MRTLSSPSRVTVMVRVALVSSLLGAVALGGVASASKPTGSKKPTTTPSHQAVVAVATIGTYGKVLTTTSGMALYTYALDKKNHSACTGSCLTAWPALTVGAKVRPTGATGLGTFRRSATSFQVTYHGKPLYTYSGDTSADTVTGDGVGNFHVVVLKATGSTSSSTTTTVASGY